MATTDGLLWHQMFCPNPETFSSRWQARLGIVSRSLDDKASSVLLRDGKGMDGAGLGWDKRVWRLDKEEDQ